MLVKDLGRFDREYEMLVKDLGRVDREYGMLVKDLGYVDRKCDMLVKTLVGLTESVTFWIKILVATRMRDTQNNGGTSAHRLCESSDPRTLVVFERVDVKGNLKLKDRGRESMELWFLLHVSLLVSTLHKFLPGGSNSSKVLLHS